MRFIEVDTYKQMSRKAANIISAQVITKPDCVLGLATGSTPLGTYEQLIKWYEKGDVDFSEAHSVNLDEYVGLNAFNEQSYRYFMNKNFFSQINIKPDNTFVPIGTADDLEAECKKHDDTIKALGGIDLQLLGIGIDGHIGFNEPEKFFTKETHTVNLEQSTIDANARFFEKSEDVPKQAITMGMGAIMQAKKIVLIANGKSKEEIVKKAFFGQITPKVPASILQLHPDVTVIYSKE